MTWIKARASRTRIARGSQIRKAPESPEKPLPRQRARAGVGYGGKRVAAGGWRSPAARLRLDWVEAVRAGAITGGLVGKAPPEVRVPAMGGCDA